MSHDGDYVRTVVQDLWSSAIDGDRRLFAMAQIDTPYVYVYLPTYIHACMHTYTYTYTCAYSFSLCIHIYIYIYTHVCILCLIQNGRTPKSAGKALAWGARRPQAGRTGSST